MRNIFQELFLWSSYMLLLKKTKHIWLHVVRSGLWSVNKPLVWRARPCCCFHCSFILHNAICNFQLPTVCCWVSNWMGDHLWVGKPSRYVTGHLGQLSLPPLQPIWLGYIHLCQISGNPVWSPYGKWHSIAVRRSSIKSYTLPLPFNL